MERISPFQHEAMSSDLLGRISISSSQGKLDFSAPLLSVRRHAPFEGADEDLVAKSEAQGNPSVGLGSLRSPGAVPFIWEHSPGQPKAKEITLSVLPAIPAPPQGRASPAHTDRSSTYPIISTDQQRFREISSDHRDGRSEGEVPVGPFVPKALFDNKKAQRPKDQQNLARVPAEKRSSLEADSAACNNSTEEGDAFSDAADTFNQNEDTTRESVISTFHDLNGSVLPIGRTDPHARDFIMRRFLPAAKAMTVESPGGSPSMLESNIQKKIHHSPVGQLQRCSIPRSPVTDRLANLTEKRVVEDSYEGEDMESAALYRKACGLFPFRISAAFKHLLPQSSPTRSKSKSKLHFVQFSRRSKVKNLAALESTGKSSNEYEYSESSSTEDEHDSGVNERYGSQSDSDRGTLIGTGLMNRIMQSPQHLLSSERIQRDYSHSSKNGSESLPSNETKGFLGLPKDVALTLAKKQGYGPGRSKTFASLSAQGQKPSQTGNNAHYCDSLAQKDVAYGSPSPSPETHFRFGRKLGNNSRLSSVHQSDLLQGDHSDESDVSTPSSDTSSLYGDGSPRATAETGETSTTDAKTDQSGNYDSNLYLHSEIPFSGVKRFSLASAQGAPWHLEGANHPLSDSMFANRLGGTNYQNLSAQAKFEADSPQNLHQRNEPASALLPPLPKSPSQSWLWRASPSPASASLFGHRTPQLKTPNLTISDTKGAKWEAMVKSGNTQPGHFRYSEELLNQSSLSINVSSGTDGRP